VSDERLREMERRWRASRSTEDAEAYLRERLRRGAYDMRAVVGELIRLRRLVEVILSTAYQSLGMNKYSTRGDVADFSVAPSPVVGEQIVTMNQMLESSLSTPSAADLVTTRYDQRAGARGPLREDEAGRPLRHGGWCPSRAAGRDTAEGLPRGVLQRVCLRRDCLWRESPGGHGDHHHVTPTMRPWR